MTGLVVTTSGYATGLVGTIGVRILDNQGGTATPRTTSGIRELAGSGIYIAALSYPGTRGWYSAAWDDATGRYDLTDFTVPDAYVSEPVIGNGSTIAAPLVASGLERNTMTGLNGTNGESGAMKTSIAATSTGNGVTTHDATSNGGNIVIRVTSDLDMVGV